MKAIKRTVAGLLASVMLMSSAVVGFGAETYTADEAVVVAKVNAAGIMTGTDNGFEPSKTLTRAEAAAIMVRMKGIPEAQVKSAAGTTLFGDVSASHWAAGYINVASSLGVIKGVGNNNFAPDKTVTIAEMTTMAVRAIGAGQLVDAQAGTWPTNYMNFAGEEKLTDGVYNVYTAEASRINAATIVANALEAKLWEKSKVTTNNEVTWEKQEYKTILNTTLEIDVIEEETCTSVSTKDNEFNGIECVEGVDLTNVKVGLLYDYWMNDDGEILGVWETEGNELKKVSFAGVDKVDTIKKEITFMVNGEEKTYDYNAGNINKQDGTKENTLTLTINEVEVNTIQETFASGKFGKQEALFGTIYTDGSDVVSIYAEIFEKAGVVEEVTDTKVKFDKDVIVATGLTGENNLKIDEDNEYFITRNGKAAKFDDLEEGDAVYWYVVGTDKFVISASSQTVEGEVTAVNSTADPSYVKIDGTKYKTTLANQMNVKDEVVAYPNKVGKILMYKEVEGAAADVAIVKYVRDIEDEYKADNWKVELFLTDGKTTDVLTVDLKDTFEEFADQSNTDLIKEVTGAGETGKTVDGTTSSTLTSGTKYYQIAVDTYFTTEAKAGYALAKPQLVKGNVICYEISGDKLTVIPKDATEPEYKPMDASSKLEVGKKLTYIVGGDVDDPKYYLDSNTKVFNVKADDSFSVKVEEVAVDSLDDMPSVDGFVAGIDKDDNSVKYVIFDASTSVKRASETNFAMIEKVAEAKYDGEKALEVEVIFMDGEKASFFFVDEEAENASADPDDCIKKLVDLTIVDDLIVNIDTLAVAPDDYISVESVSANKYLAKLYSRGTFDLTDGTTDGNGDLVVKASYDLADEVLVLFYDKEDKEFIVKDFDDIEEYDADADTKYEITHISTYVDDSSEDEAEVVFVIYQEV